MKIVKKKQWYQNKKKKKFACNIKLKKNVTLFLIKMWLCIGLVIFYYITDILNIYLKNKKNNINNSKTKVCLCCAAKKENLYISEFVNHYKKLGYNNIIIYDNNDIDGERFEEVIQDEIDSGFVKMVNFRSYRGKKDDTQLDAYYDCYRRFNSQCNWISFFDIDEFLYIMPVDGKNLTIQEMLDRPAYNHCENVKINWKSYSDSEKLYYENKPVTERFTQLSRFGYEFGNVKSTIRTNISRGLLRSNSAHSLFRNVKGCLSSGRRKQVDFYMFPPDYKGAVIKHYVTKTISEYCNKIKRGDVKKTYKIDQGRLWERFHYFFLTNKKTQEKVDIFNRIFNTSFK